MKNLKATTFTFFLPLPQVALPEGLNGDCMKELSEDSAFLQQARGQNTYELTRKDMNIVETHNRSGLLRGYVAEHGLVYAEEIGDSCSYTLRTSLTGLRLQPGAMYPPWGDVDSLTVTASSDHIIVLSEHYLFLFDQQGNKNSIH